MALGGWVLLGAVAWAGAMTVVLLLMRMADEQDRAARHAEKRVFPHSDVTVTHWMPE